MGAKSVRFIDYYEGGIEKEDILPDCSQYDFLALRNSGYEDYIALSFYGRKVTYKEMHICIDEYARALYSRGIRQDVKVGLCLLNTPESVYTLYALIKLGAVIVGLSPLNNVFKMRKDIELSQPQTIIFSEPLQELIIGACPGIEIESIFYIPVQVSTDTKSNMSSQYCNLPELVKKKAGSYVKYGEYVPNSVSDILFTGGSTGVHKGVDLTGNGLNCVVKALDHVLVLKPGMIHLGNIPMIHMAFGRLVLHYALCNNLEYALTLDALPNKFYDELVRTKANGAMGGPIHWESLISNTNVKEGSLTHLMQALSGGEHFKPESRTAANEALKFAGCSVGIGDGLGLTEMWAPTHVCMYGKNTPGTIGYPIPFLSAKIIDPKTFDEVETGKEGLLLVSGPGMMLGYHNNEDETRKVFIYDSDGTKWYNTGDLAVKKNNSEFSYIGRKKRNFVCGVDNIYPEQIESLLLQIDSIVEAAVTKVPDKKKQYLPKYHIYLKNKDCNTNELEKTIHELVSTTLGESACPGYIEYRLSPLPRTDNGKVDVTLLERDS